MRANPQSARLLVVSNDIDDGARVKHCLEGHFDAIDVSVAGEGAVQEFERSRPDVLVLAFDGLDAAQSHSLDLYRHGRALQGHPYRTVLLCSKEQLDRAFDLCKTGVFDDYVLHPAADDGQRLTMSVWNAARSVLHQAGPSAQDLEAHARRIVGMDAALRRELARGEELAALATESLLRAEREVVAVIDPLSQSEPDPTRETSHPQARDSGALGRGPKRGKREAVTQAFERANAVGLASLTAWPGTFREQLESHLAQLRGFAHQASEARLTVLVVEDDSFSRDLIAQALESQRYDLLFAHDAAAALGHLRSIVPSLILMDVNLPDMNGVLLTRTLKEAPHLATVPVLMLTGAASRETVEGSVSAGAVGFIVKPFTRQSLLTKLDKLLPLPA